MNKTIKVLSLAAVLALTGCVNLAPQTELPEVQIAQAWPEGAAYKASEIKRGALPSWEEFFKDSRLRQVIELGLANNKDLRIAALNVEKARAMYGVQRSELLPTISAAGSGQHQRTPASVNPVSAGTSHQYTAQIAMAQYELDFFGRIRNLNEQALQSYLASEDARRSARNTLIAEIAMTWYQLGADEEQLKLQREVLASQEESFSLMEASYKLGALSQLDYEQAKSTVSAARASIASYVRAVEQDKNALNLLVGGEVAEDLLPKEMDVDSVSAVTVPEGLPSEVLLNRPDIAQAERGLISADAAIGAARAAFFPSVSINGGVGSGASQLSDLFDAGTGFWNFVPRLNIPIFTGGLNAANLEAAKAEQRIAVATYEKAIESAFREVADSLALEGTIEEELLSRAEYAASNEKTFRLTEAQYKYGAVSYTDVLNAQRSYVTAEQALLGTQLQRISSRVTLFKVLGAGAVDEREGGE